MSSGSPEPQSLTAQALVLQAQQREALELMNRTLAGVVNNPGDAYQSLPEAAQKCEDFFRSQEAFLGKMGDWGAQQIPQLKKEQLDLKVSAQFGRGQAAILLGKFAEARAHFEDALALIGDQPDPRRSMIRASLAQLRTLEG